MSIMFLPYARHCCECGVCSERRVYPERRVYLERRVCRARACPTVSAGRTPLGRSPQL